jgi:hypothetical protein
VYSESPVGIILAASKFPRIETKSLDPRFSDLPPLIRVPITKSESIKASINLGIDSGS